MSTPKCKLFNNDIYCLIICFTQDVSSSDYFQITMFSYLLSSISSQSITGLHSSNKHNLSCPFTFFHNLIIVFGHAYSFKNSFNFILTSPFSFRSTLHASDIVLPSYNGIHCNFVFLQLTFPLFPTVLCNTESAPTVQCMVLPVHV